MDEKSQDKDASPTKQFLPTKNVIIKNDDICNITNNRNPLTTTVYEKLISRFIDNVFIPGQILNRRQLADEMGVNIVPMSEAFIQLQLDGFIEIIPRKGTIVRSIRERDVYERFVIREALECTAARLYTGLPIRLNKDELLAYASQIDNKEINSLPRIKDDITLHASIVNLAGIPSLTREFLRATRIGVFYMMNQVSFSKGIVVQNHIELIEKLTTDNPDEAEKIIREHIWSSKLATLKYYLVPDFNRE